MHRSFTEVELTCKHSALTLALAADLFFACISPQGCLVISQTVRI